MWHSQDEDERRPRPPRAEPEILPPEAPEPRRRGPERLFVRQRVFIARPGPVALVLGLLALAALGVVSVIALLSFTLLMLPGIAVGIAVLLLAALLRGPRR